MNFIHYLNKYKTKQTSTRRRGYQRLLVALFIILVSTGMSGTVQPASSVAASLDDADNLIENGGFEDGRGSTVDVWNSNGDITWTSQDSFSGVRSMQVTANDSSSSIQSSWFQAPAHSRIEVSAWLKAEDVVDSGSYFKLRITLQGFDQERENRIRHWDLVTLDGTFDWKQIQNSIIVPPNIAWMRLSIQLTESSGTFWVDDVHVRLAQTRLEVAEFNLGAPVVVPQPWQMSASGETIGLRRLGIVGLDGDRRLWQQLSPLFEEMSLTYVFVPEGGAVNLYDTVLRVGDSSDPELDQYFRSRFTNILWSDLGDQGYFLSTGRKQRQNIIYIGGNTEQAQFYAIQTLKQLLNVAEMSAPTVDIADRPSIQQRGAPLGIQWFREQEEFLSRMASLKFNFAWIQGSFLSEKFRYEWREPLDDDDKERIQSFVERAKSLFITPHIAIAPRGPDASSPTLFSSDTEIDIVVEKMSTLYELGVRHFGLSFDDLVNVEQDVLYGADIEFFENNIGAAHVYFTEQVYERLSARHEDIHLMIVPMTYNALSHRGDSDETYLRVLAQLPDAIGIYSSIERTRGASAAIEFTNRPHMVWDNFWSSFYQSTPAPETVIPLERPTEFNAELIQGYSFAPLIPEMEDEYLITWRTAADYAWAPERYDAETSFQLAATQHLRGSAFQEEQSLAPGPYIQPDSGIYAPPFTVTLTLPEIDAERTNQIGLDRSEMQIRYTIDGSIPTAESLLYTQPFAMFDGVNARIRARIYQDDRPISTVTTAFFQVSPDGAIPPKIVGSTGDMLSNLMGSTVEPAPMYILGGVITFAAIVGGIYWGIKNRTNVL